MSFAPVITPTGIIAPSFPDILAYLKEQYRSLYGQDIYLGNDSQDGQFLTILATLIHDTNDAIIAAYNAFSPATAQGVGLSTVVKINGIRRLIPSNSQAVVQIVGQAGTTIRSGQIADQAGIRWALPALVVIPEDGDVEVTATAVDAGAIPASANTLTVIVTPTRGWQSVTNADPATPGLPVEDDATLRQRQSVSTAIPALSVIDAILGGIKNIIGVGRATIYENDTGTTDANGVPGHSICAVVQGGDADTIGATIARYKTPGTGTFGGTTVTVQDGIGPPIAISFDELDLITISTIVKLDPETGYLSSTGDAITNAIAYWLSGLDIGQDSFLNKLWSPVNLTGDAATLGNNTTQAALDLLALTYNATAIYQAREDMVVEDGPFIAGATAIHVGNPDDFKASQAIAITLDNNSIHYTTVNGAPSGTTINISNAIPVGRSVQNGALVYIAGDLTIAFNEAAEATAADTRLVVS